MTENINQNIKGQSGVQCPENEEAQPNPTPFITFRHWHGTDCFSSGTSNWQIFMKTALSGSLVDCPTQYVGTKHVKVVCWSSQIFERNISGELQRRIHARHAESCCVDVQLLRRWTARSELETATDAVQWLLQWVGARPTSVHVRVVVGLLKFL